MWVCVYECICIYNWKGWLDDLHLARIIFCVLLMIHYIYNQKIFIPFDGFISILSVISECSVDQSVNNLIRHHLQHLGPPLPRHSRRTNRPYSLSKRQWSHRHHLPHRRPHGQPAQRYSGWDDIMKETTIIHCAYRSSWWCVVGGRFGFRWWSPRDMTSVAGSKASTRAECQGAPRWPQQSGRTICYHHYRHYFLLTAFVGWRARPWSRRACFVLEVASWSGAEATSHSRAGRGSPPARFASSKRARRRSFCYCRCSKWSTISSTNFTIIITVNHSSRRRLSWQRQAGICSTAAADGRWLSPPWIGSRRRRWGRSCCRSACWSRSPLASQSCPASESWDTS